jgi:hypothetical protein
MEWLKQYQDGCDRNIYAWRPEDKIVSVGITTGKTKWETGG